MHLTNLEYLSLKARFHCTAWPDEDSRVPVQIDNPTGDGVWTAYLFGADVQPVRGWIRARREAALELLEEPAPASTASEQTDIKSELPQANTLRKAA